MNAFPALPIATALGEISATTEVTAPPDGTLLRVMVALPRASEEPATVPVAEFCIAAARAGRRSPPAMRIPMIPVAISRPALRDPLTLTPPSFNSPARFFPRPAPLTAQFTRTLNRIALSEPAGRFEVWFACPETPPTVIRSGPGGPPLSATEAISSGPPSTSDSAVQVPAQIAAPFEPVGTTVDSRVLGT